MLPVDNTTQNSIMQHIEEFLLGRLLPLLGPECRTAAAVEATVSEELLDLHLANAQLGQRLTKWCESQSTQQNHMTLSACIRIQRGSRSGGIL
jgi:hypothetical protein